MSEMRKIATRDSYGNALVALGREHENLVVLDADLAAATKTGMFKKVFPDRHIDCGIAESNMMGIAAGLATTGKVRNSIGYPHLNVKIGATHAGISVGEDGASHQCNEDIALMRTIPGMTIVVPADDIEAREAVRAAYETDGPFYLRFGRLAVPVINDRPDYHFELGKGSVVREGTDLALIACGLEVGEALQAAARLEEDGISARVINMHTIKPLDRDLLIRSAADCGRVVTVEEHSIIGGLGSAVAETLAEEYPARLLRIGIRDRFGESGPAAELLHKYQLDAEGIYRQIRAWVSEL